MKGREHTVCQYVPYTRHTDKRTVLTNQIKRGLTYPKRFLFKFHTFIHLSTDLNLLVFRKSPKVSSEYYHSVVLLYRQFNNGLLQSASSVGALRLY